MCDQRSAFSFAPLTSQNADGEELAHKFTPGASSRGWPSFVDMTDLSDPALGFLDDEWITFAARISFKNRKENSIAEEDSPRQSASPVAAQMSKSHDGEEEGHLSYKQTDIWFPSQKTVRLLATLLFLSKVVDCRSHRRVCLDCCKLLRTKDSSCLNGASEMDAVRNHHLLLTQPTSPTLTTQASCITWGFVSTNVWG